MQSIQRTCQMCSKQGTMVYVIPDPYWGYGHYPKLCCGTCVPDGSNAVFYEGHKYNPEYDDYHLGFTMDKPLDWMWSFNAPPTRCNDCRGLITTEKRGHGYVHETPEDTWPNDGREVYYCQPCFRSRKGIGRVNLSQIALTKARSLKRRRWSSRYPTKRLKLANGNWK